MKQLMKKKRAVADEKAAAAVQKKEYYHQRLDIAARADAKEGIRQGLEDARKRRMRPVKEFFKEFEDKHGIGT